MTELYQPYHLNLSDNQARRFADGKKIRVKHSHLHGPDLIVFLSTRQIAKVQDAKAKGKGVDLMLSVSQRDYHVRSRHGKGRFGDFFRAVKRRVRNGALIVAQKVGRLGVEGVHRAASTFIRSKMPEGRLQDLVQDGIRAGNNLAKDELEKYLEGLKQSRNGAGLSYRFNAIQPISVESLVAPSLLGAQVSFPKPHYQKPRLQSRLLKKPIVPL
jgi:hypothetical protein